MRTTEIGLCAQNMLIIIFSILLYFIFCISISIFLGGGLARVEAPIKDHLRDYAPSLEKYKVVQNFPI